MDRGVVAGLGQGRGRCRGEPADDAERRAFELGLDARRRLVARHLDRDVEAEGHVGERGLEAGAVVGRILLGEVAHAVDARHEEAGVAHGVEHRLARRPHRDVAGEVHAVGRQRNR